MDQNAKIECSLIWKQMVVSIFTGNVSSKKLPMCFKDKYVHENTKSMFPFLDINLLSCFSSVKFKPYRSVYG